MTDRPPRLLDRMRGAAHETLLLSHRKGVCVLGQTLCPFHGKRHLEELAESEIEASLSYLAMEHRVAASTQNQAFCTIKNSRPDGVGFSLCFNNRDLLY